MFVDIYIYINIYIHIICVNIYLYIPILCVRTGVCVRVLCGVLAHVYTNCIGIHTFGKILQFGYAITIQFPISAVQKR